MRMALELAARAGAETRPNPKVGAVVVRSGRIVGLGVHRRAGEPHAEVLALRQAGARAKGAALYVTLEPCAHTGRTPPCTEAIRRAGVTRIIAAMVDPNPKTRGRGFQCLRRFGLQVRSGLLKKEAEKLNRVFITWITKRRPFVTVKIAQSLDGKIAVIGGSSRWISSPASRAWTHRLRAQADAILVGVETVLKDDPRLTVRTGSQRRQPAKIVLDSRLRTPSDARLFASGGKVILATTEAADRTREKRLIRSGAEVLRLPVAHGGRVDLDVLLRWLARREISHLLIEGGGETVASALAARAVDRVAWVLAPKLIGGRAAPGSVGGEGIRSLAQAVRLTDVQVKPIGKDWLVTANVGYSKKR